MMQGYHGAAGQLDLTDDQREKITKIHEALAMKHWELMGKMQEQRFVFRDMLASGKADDAAIGRAFKRMEELRQQMRGAGADAQPAPATRRRGAKKPAELAEVLDGLAMLGDLLASGTGAARRWSATGKRAA